MKKLWTSIILGSPVGKAGEKLWEENMRDFQMPLTRWGKLAITLYLIARDAREGRFPPAPAGSLEEAHRREVGYLDNLPGISREEMDKQGLAKPFWGGARMRRMLADFCRVADLLHDAGIAPPARILEVGCGAGWLSEMLARMNYDVLGSTLDPRTAALARRRARAVEQLNEDGRLDFRAAAAETLRENLAGEGPFDAVLVYEALHHMHDWRLGLREMSAMLRPGGCLFILNEPNLVHTLKSYRVACLTGTREIGLSYRKLRDHLVSLGFKSVRRPYKWLGCGIRPIWIAAEGIDGIG